MSDFTARASCRRGRIRIRQRRQQQQQEWEGEEQGVSATVVVISRWSKLRIQYSKSLERTCVQKKRCPGMNFVFTGQKYRRLLANSKRCL